MKSSTMYSHFKDRLRYGESLSSSLSTSDFLSYLPVTDLCCMFSSASATTYIFIELLMRIFDKHGILICKPHLE